MPSDCSCFVCSYYTDRQYVILNLPDYMKGLWGVKTPNDDKHSDPTDLEYLCFDISHKAVVYVLYDTRASDRPTCECHNDPYRWGGTQIKL